MADTAVYNLVSCYYQRRNNAVQHRAADLLYVIGSARWSPTSRTLLWPSLSLSFSCTSAVRYQQPDLVKWTPGITKTTVANCCTADIRQQCSGGYRANPVMAYPYRIFASVGRMSEGNSNSIHLNRWLDSLYRTASSRQIAKKLTRSNCSEKQWKQHEPLRGFPVIFRRVGFSLFS